MWSTLTYVSKAVGREDSVNAVCTEGGRLDVHVDATDDKIERMQVDVDVAANIASTVLLMPIW